MSRIRRVCVGVIASAMLTGAVGFAAQAASLPDTNAPQLQLNRLIRTSPFVGTTTSMRDNEGSAYVAADDALWVIDDNGKSVYEMDRSTGALRRVIGGTPFANAPQFGIGTPAGTSRNRDFKALAYDATADELYALNGSSSSIPTVFRLVRDGTGMFQVQSWQPLPSGFAAAGWRGADGLLYVADSSYLRTYNYATNTLGSIFTISGLTHILGLDFDDSSGDLVAVNAAKELVRASMTTKTILPGWRIGLAGLGALDPRGVEVIGDQILVADGYDTRPAGDPMIHAVFVLDVTGSATTTTTASTSTSTSTSTTSTSTSTSTTSTSTTTTTMPPTSPTDCLARTPLVTLAGIQFARYRPTINTATAIDARTASWTQINAKPVSISGTGSVCWHGGEIVGTYALDTTWSLYHDTGALSVYNPGSVVEGLRVDNYGDGIRIRQGASNWTIRGVHSTFLHDDCVEDDNLNAGTISDSLFDGCYVGISTRRSSSDTVSDGRTNTLTVERSLLRLQPMPTVYKGTAPGHGGFFKWDDVGGFSPKLELRDNVFRVDQAPNHGTLNLPIGDAVTCSNNVIVWLGSGAFPGTASWLASCPDTRIVTDRAVWDAAAAQWSANH